MRRGLYRERRRVSLVDVTDEREQDGVLRARCVLVPAPGLDNDRPPEWPIALSREHSTIGPDRRANAYISLWVEFDPALIAAATSYASDLARRLGPGDRNEQILAFLARRIAS